MKRLMQRNHITQEEAMHLIGQQISIEKKKDMADFVIDNRSYYEELYQEIERVLIPLSFNLLAASMTIGFLPV